MYLQPKLERKSYRIFMGFDGWMKKLKVVSFPVYHTTHPVGVCTVINYLMKFPTGGLIVLGHG